MTPGRLAAILFAAGVVVGTWSDQLPERQIPRVGDYWILAADFHVHVFPGDGALPSIAIPREAARAGLDVVAITSHNVTWPGRLARWWAGASGGPVVLAGQEITNPAYHLIGAGLDRTVNWWQPAASAIADVHAQGGVAIAAHPGRGYWGGFDDRARATLDGTEAVHNDVIPSPRGVAELDAFYETVRAVNPTLAAIGSSDFHSVAPLGVSRTYIFAREQSEPAVMDAIRNGRTVAADPEGVLRGDPELVRLVSANRPVGRQDPYGGWRRVGVVFAWFGLVGLLLFRSPRPTD